MRHDNVEFRFQSSNLEEILRGQVLFRDGKMLLSLQGVAGRYSIEGMPHSHWFQGENEKRSGYPTVTAAWALVGDAYVGTWLEVGKAFLFTFKVQ